MTYSKLPTGIHAGRTLPEVILASEDPSYVYGGLAAGVFTGALLAEAEAVTDRASRIRLPGAKDGDVVMYYRHAGAESFGGFAVVSKKEARKCAPFAAAQSVGLDLSMAGKVAPKDPRGGAMVVSGLKVAVWGELHPHLTAEDCAVFFDDERNFF